MFQSRPSGRAGFLGLANAPPAIYPLGRQEKLYYARCHGEAASLHRRRAMRFTRIAVNPKQMGGVPCIRGLRIPVATVVGMVADGMAEAEILAAYPDLEHEDLVEALRYAADAVRERELPLVGS